MRTYIVTATATVDLEIHIRADSEDAARKLFHDNIALNATLIGMDEADFDVVDDSISEIDDFAVCGEGE